jgi:hypothetical protein
MRRTTVLCSISALAALLLAVLPLPGCNVQPTGVPEIDGEAGEPVPGPQAFAIFFSADRSRLIRGDAEQGTATLTVAATHPARFDWDVDDPDRVLRVALPDDPESDPATESSIQIGLSDVNAPAASGSTVVFRVNATREGTQGPEAETREALLSLLIVRPAGALTATLTSPTGASARPGETIRLDLRITGGEPLNNPGVVQPGACEDEPGFAPDDLVECAFGEDGPYRVTWSVDGVDQEERQLDCVALCSDDNAVVSFARFGVPSDKRGNIVFGVNVQDRTGNAVNTSLPVIVAPEDALTIVEAIAEQPLIAPGRQVALSVRPRGGQPPYQVTCTVDPERRGGSLSPAGAGPEDGDDSVVCADLDDGNACGVLYSASTEEVGSDLVSVEVEDALGTTVGTAISLVVTAEQELRLIAAVEDLSVEPGERTRINATIAGGTPPFTVCYRSEGLDEDGDGDGPDPLDGGDCSDEPYTNCSCEIVPEEGSTDIEVSRGYTAPLAVGNDIVRVRVRDLVGAQSTALVPVTIKPKAELAVTASASPTAVPPGESATITADPEGGVPPYEVCYEVRPVPDRAIGTLSLEGGGCPGRALCYCDVPAGVSKPATYTAPRDIGSDNIVVRVTDAVGAVASAVTTVSFASGGPGGGEALRLQASADNPIVIPADDTQIRATAGGGVPTGGQYGYTFTMRRDLRPERFVADAFAHVPGNRDTRISTLNNHEDTRAEIAFQVLGGDGPYAFTAAIDDPAGGEALNPDNGAGFGRGEFRTLTYKPPTDGTTGRRTIRIRAVDRDAQNREEVVREILVLLNVIAPATVPVVQMTGATKVITHESANVAFSVVGGTPPYRWTATLLEGPGGTLAPTSGSLPGDGGAQTTYTPPAASAAVGPQTIELEVIDDDGNGVTVTVHTSIHVIGHDSYFEPVAGTRVTEFTQQNSGAVALKYVAPARDFIQAIPGKALTDAIDVKATDGIESRTVLVNIRVTESFLRTNPVAIPDCVAEDGTVILVGNFTGGTGPFRFLWQAATGSFAEAGEQDTTWTPDQALPSLVTITLTITDENDNSEASGVVVVDVIPSADACLNASNNCPDGVGAFVCEGDPLKLIGLPDDRGNEFTYQWIRPGNQKVPGRDLDLGNADLNEAGTYTFELAHLSKAGCLSRDAIEIGVGEATVITRQPADLTRCEGRRAEFRVEAFGHGRLTYQWRKGGQDIPDATRDTFVIETVAPGDAGSYDVVVTGTCGPVTSDSAELIVLPRTLQIGQPPASAQGCIRDRVQFSVVASGTGTLRYQWRKDTQAIANATQSTFVIDQIRPADTGQYDVVVMDDCDTMTSAPALLTVLRYTRITQQPMGPGMGPGRGFARGTDIAISIQAEGDGLTYQWEAISTFGIGSTIDLREGGRGGRLRGTDTPTLRILDARPSDGGRYRCIVRGTCGKAVSDWLNVVVE